MKMNIPCKDCLKLAMCRHKKYSDVIYDCIDINHLLYNNDHISPENRDQIYIRGLISNRNEGFENIVEKIEKIMKPTSWHLRPCSEMLRNGNIVRKLVFSKKDDNDHEHTL